MTFAYSRVHHSVYCTTHEELSKIICHLSIFFVIPCEKGNVERGAEGVTPCCPPASPRPTFLKFVGVLTKYVGKIS